jgi:triacylglycerol esterase/lipase EstA (alpha/beta hydrolase family)
MGIAYDLGRGVNPMNPNLVFASGVLIPQKLTGLAYFKDLANVYPAATTLFPPVSVLGSVQLRAQELADRITNKFPAGQIHVIAHSMGGLDARCLLAKNLNGLADKGRIISLSTISTPHRGSPVADVILGHPIGLEFPFSGFLAQFINVNAHALLDLTTAVAPGFAEKDPVPSVTYFAYAGSGLGSALLFPTHVLIENSEGENDGMVSVQSATWPGNLTEPAWNGADHFAEIGYDLNWPDLATPFDFKGAIARVVTRATM